MRKVFIMMFFFLLTPFVYSQNVIDLNDNILELGSRGNFGITSLIFNPPRNTDGSVYLFESWDNDAFMFSKDSTNNKYFIRNINLNAKINTIESKIDDDNVFVFDFANLEKIIINDRVFKSVYFPLEGIHKILEVIAENKDFAMYKDYNIDVIQGSPNPLISRPNDKYILKKGYYYKKGEQFDKFKLKKSNILKIIGSKSSDIDKYAKRNDLNFKNEEDVQKIVNYYMTL